MSESDSESTEPAGSTEEFTETKSKTKTGTGTGTDTGTGTETKTETKIVGSDTFEKRKTEDLEELEAILNELYEALSTRALSNAQYFGLRAYLIELKNNALNSKGPADTAEQWELFEYALEQVNIRIDHLVLKNEDKLKILARVKELFDYSFDEAIYFEMNLPLSLIYEDEKSPKKKELLEKISKESYSLGLNWGEEECLKQLKKLYEKAIAVDNDLQGFRILEQTTNYIKIQIPYEYFNKEYGFLKAKVIQLFLFINSLQSSSSSSKTNLKF